MNLKQQLQNNVPTHFDFTALIWATGSGKTGAVGRLINEKKGQWVFLTNEIMNIDSLKKEMIARGFEDVANIPFYCYASLHKVVELHPNANIVLDEAQEVFTEKRLELLNQLNPFQVIVSTATIDHNQVMDLSKIFNFEEDEMYIERRSLIRNINDGILPQPLVMKYPVSLDNTRKTEEFILSAGGKKLELEGELSERWDLYKQAKGTKGGYIIRLRCTEQEFYDTTTADIAYYARSLFKVAPGVRKMYQHKMKVLGLSRAKFLARVKERKTLEIIESLRSNNARFLAFAYSTESAKAFSENTIYSGNSKTRNIELIDKFNKGLINELSANKMLNAGVNLDNIEEAVFQHLEKSLVKFIQKTGRAIRAREPVVHYVYVTNTVDEENVNKLTALVSNFKKEKNSISYDDS